MRTARALILFCSIFALPVAAGAQDIADHSRVREAVRVVEVWLDAQRAYERIPGISAALVHDQDVLWAGGTGTADPETGTPTTAETVYSICSISKLFTAIGVMQLRDEGRFRLDDRVEDVLPWFEIGQTYPGSPPVTVRALLTHSSGLPRESDYPYWVEPFDFPTREQVASRIGDQEMLYPSDRYYQYSNLGLTLAGEIVAEVSGMPYGEYVRTRILDPIGMTDTWPDIGEYPHPERLAVGYSSVRRSGDREPLPAYSAEGISPAAGFASTVQDLADFARWQFRVLASEGDAILGANTLREMQRVHWLDPGWQTTRGLGFGVYRDQGVTYVGHNGLCPGYRSSIRLHPESHMAAVVMMNAIAVSPSELALEMIRLVGPAVDQAISEVAQSEDDRPTAEPEFPAGFERFVGSYDENPWGGEAAVLPWDGGLAILWLPTMDPSDGLTPIEHVEGNLFQRIRSDGEPGEAYEFVEDADGRVIGLRYHSNTYPRMGIGQVAPVAPTG